MKFLLLFFLILSTLKFGLKLLKKRNYIINDSRILLFIMILSYIGLIHFLIPNMEFFESIADSNLFFTQLLPILETFYYIFIIENYYLYIIMIITISIGWVLHRRKKDGKKKILRLFITSFICLNLILFSLI
jgi:hypothetical protein